MSSRASRRILVLGSAILGILGVAAIMADVLNAGGVVSQTSGEVIRYLAACLFGFVLIWTATRIVSARIVRRLLWAGQFFILSAALLNVSDDFRVLDGWPILGENSALNNPIKDASEILALLVMLVALIATILVSKKAQDELLLKHAQLLAEVAERERSEAARMKLEDQYRQAQKLEAIGQLTGGVAHDFNNLLQVITGYTEVAASIAEDHLVRDALSEIGKAGDRAARLVSQLLLFGRRQIMRPESLDMNDVVANLLKMLGRVIGEHIQLEWRPGVRVGTIFADRGMVEQTLMNLCVNARDAMPDGGKLTIATHGVTYTDALPEMDLHWAKAGRYVLLTVQDSGCGMDEEILEHIFEPFFTTKELGSGTGLGLATVYGIVKQHSGTIHVASEP